MKTFEDYKTGDYIFHKNKGWLRIVIYPGSYPVEAGNCHYDLNGHAPKTCGCPSILNGYAPKTCAKYPSLLTYNPFDLDDKPPCKFKKGEIIMCRNHSSHTWQSDKFSHKTPSYYLCSKDVYKFARKLTREEKGE